MKKLRRRADAAWRTSSASGVLALGPKLGPVLWQLPPNLGVRRRPAAPRSSTSCRATTADAAALAAEHDERLDDRAWTTTDADRPLRHVLEVRHATFETPSFVDLLREHGVGIVVADTDGRWPVIEDVTADFVYVRLHGDEELYASGYDDESLDRWAARVQVWADGGEPADAKRLAGPVDPVAGRDVFVYFDNDIKVRAPYDSMALAARLGIGPTARSTVWGSVAPETLDQAAVALRRAARAAVARARLDVLLGRRCGGAVEVARDGDGGADALHDGPLHDDDPLALAAADVDLVAGDHHRRGLGALAVDADVARPCRRRRPPTSSGRGGPPTSRRPPAHASPRSRTEPLTRRTRENFPATGERARYRLGRPFRPRSRQAGTARDPTTWTETRR